MNPPLVVLIPSHDRDGLLERTLESLAACELPPRLRRVVVAENGGKLGAEALVTKFQSRLPIGYRYTAVGNKSRALNEALTELTDELVIFYDDDVRLAPASLRAYAEVAKDLKAGMFMGGRCLAEYEEPPPDWLSAYLPASAVGWSLGDQVCPLTRPDALGFNWAAFAADLKTMGGFNEERGPGTRSRGQERDMMVRLLARGVTGQYIPEAVAWHWVPQSRCSPEWALRRAEQMGAYHGMEYRKRPWPRRLYTRVGLQLRIPWLRFQANRLPAGTPPAARFARQYKVRWHQGALLGMRGH